MPRMSAERRRVALTTAAVAVLAEHGPAGVTTRRVAERAGAPLGTVHYAFRGKDELLEAATGQLLEAFAATLRRAVRPELGVRQALADCLAGCRAWLDDDRALALAAVETLATRLRGGGAAAAFDDASAIVHELLRAAAAHDAVPPRTGLAELARATVIVADGFLLAHVAASDPASADADLRRLTEALQALV